MSKPKEYSFMTQNKLMTYTFVALLVLVAVGFFSWGTTLVIMAAIAVLVAVGIDFLFAKVAVDSPLNTLSAAVFGLIVTLSYSLGVPTMHSIEPLPFTGNSVYIYVAFISMVGMVVFKKALAIGGRKYVNPAAAAKFLILLPFLNTVFLASDHLKIAVALPDGSIYNAVIPKLAGALKFNPTTFDGFGDYLKSCLSNPAVAKAPDLWWTMIVQKFHGWAGGASSIAVIIVGLALFLLARRYIKWRITLAYFVTVILFSVLLSAIYGGDQLIRLYFELFIGSSIFMAFFMATDPATTPLTYTGQSIFGVGLGVLTVLIQTYLNFFGGAIMALLIMNLFSSKLDKVGLLKPIEGKVEAKLPKAQQFKSVRTIACMRCGACMRVCCHKLSPILIKEAFDKQKVERLVELKADLCDGCGHCSFVCPVRLDLKGSVLRSKAMLRSE
jgi:Na+-translocating ferredoxin:NAD+ oxidoreductase subunit D